VTALFPDDVLGPHIEPRYRLILLPKFHVVRDSELFGRFDGGVVVDTIDLDGLDELTVSPNDICSIDGHLRSNPRRRTSDRRRWRKTV
jgi:hypothetical protein